MSKCSEIYNALHTEAEKHFYYQIQAIPGNVFLSNLYTLWKEWVIAQLQVIFF